MYLGWFLWGELWLSVLLFKQLGLVAGHEFRTGHWVHGLDGLAYGHIANAAEIAVNIQDLSLDSFAVLLKQEIEVTNGIPANPIGFVH